MAIDIDSAPILVNKSDLEDLIEEKDKLKNTIEFYNQVLKNIELFLTFWYDETTEFGKVKDAFNDLDDPSCEMRVVNGRVKLKLNDEENTNPS